MKHATREKIITTLRKETVLFVPPLINQLISEFGHDPYIILIGCLLSLRVRDSTTIFVARELFSQARTPHQVLAFSIPELEKILFRTGFYRNKTKTVVAVSRDLIERFQGKVPATLEQLMSIKGVGLKTANLVLGMAFGTPAICVDTHVHRISNRLGMIKTATVEQTELALKEELPEKEWIEWNKLLVMWGQNICVPLSPKCSSCALRPWCKRIGVTKSR